MNDDVTLTFFTDFIFCFNTICSLADEKFRKALGVYLGDGLKNDMITAVNGGTVLEGMQTLLATTSPSLIT